MSESMDRAQGRRCLLLSLLSSSSCRVVIVVGVCHQSQPPCIEQLVIRVRCRLASRTASREGGPFPRCFRLRSQRHVSADSELC